MRNNFVPLSLSLITFIIFLTPSIAEPKPSFVFPVDQLLNKTSSWLDFPAKFNQPKIELTASTIIAAVLSFLASSISSAGGIGGGGLYVPIMTIVAGLDLKTASSFSAFMVTGGSVANVGCNLFVRNPTSGGKTLIDFDLALLLEPCMLLGVSIGVICNLVFPNWLITILFAVFLAWSTVKTFGNGIYYWRLESEMVKIRESNRIGEDEDQIESVKMPLLGDDYERPKRFPWIKLGVLVIIWLSYFAVYLLRGNKYGERNKPTRTNKAQQRPKQRGKLRDKLCGPESMHHDTRQRCSNAGKQSANGRKRRRSAPNQLFVETRNHLLIHAPQNHRKSPASKENKPHNHHRKQPRPRGAFADGIKKPVEFHFELVL